MGHFSHNCKLTGLPITSGKAVLIVMKPQDNLWDNSEQKLRKYGKTYMCSNDGPRLKYIPCWFPIMGEYDTYGRLENIVHDDNTVILEEYYGLTIEELVDIVCSSRKDDGYDGVLNKIKVKPNPDYDDYNKPQYDEKYKELVRLSGMWVHGDLYEQLTKEKIVDQWENSLDLGTPQILTALGFKELPKRGRGRYNRNFEKDGLIVKSDGTWLEIPNEHIYRLKDFKKYCKRKGVDIDIEDLDKKDLYEQIFDYVIPTFEIPQKIKQLTKEELEGYKKLFKNIRTKIDDEENVNVDDDEEFMEFISSVLERTSLDNSYAGSRVYKMFLNTDSFGSSKISNPLTPIYMEKAKEGKLRDNIIRFWRFDQYMFACGKYYEIVGNGPQDGEHRLVHKVLKTAISILENEISEFEEYEDEEHEDEEF